MVASVHFALPTAGLQPMWYSVATSLQTSGQNSDCPYCREAVECGGRGMTFSLALWHRGGGGAAPKEGLLIMPAHAAQQCEVCGATDRDDAGRCGVCGSSLAETGSDQPPPPQTPQRSNGSREPPREAVADRECQSCGMRVEDPAASFCSACGARLPTEEAAPRVCPHPGCGQPLGEGAAFCSYCGQPTAAPAPAQTAAPAQVPGSPQVCANPACGQPLREGHTFCTHCGTRSAAEVGEASAAAAAAAPGVRPAPGKTARSWRRGLGLSLAALGLVLILGAAAWGFRVFGELPFGGGARPSPKTLADDDTDIWAEMDEIRAGADAELDRKLEEISERPTEDAVRPDDETAETDVSGAEEASP